MNDPEPEGRNLFIFSFGHQKTSFGLRFSPAYDDRKHV
jgi:hypothetical protein